MRSRILRRRRIGAVLTSALLLIVIFLTNGDMYQMQVTDRGAVSTTAIGDAAELLATIPIKGRAPKANYSREQFGDGWATMNGCDTRDVILHRDLASAVTSDECEVLSGTLSDSYTGQTIEFKRGAKTSSAVQIDHVVALGNAWQTGAQQLTYERRVKLANDPLELIAVEGLANQQKSDGDAATWLPSNKSFRCQYVARQIAVKAKYDLWVTQAEYDAMTSILARCPGQVLPSA